MTKSDSLTGFDLMITDAYITVFAFGDMSAVMTNDSSGVSFFVDKYSDFFSLFEIFLYVSTRQLGKIWSDLLAHIHQKYRFFGSLYGMIKTFVIHAISIIKNISKSIQKISESLRRAACIQRS